MTPGAAEAGTAHGAGETVVTCELADEHATAALAAALAPALKCGDVVALTGALGSGKTAFARALLHALGHAGEVPSPTFTLLQVYDMPDVTVWHFDLYRLAAADEALEIGIEEAFAEAVSLIEWPEILGVLLPADRLDVALEFADGGPDRRRVVLTGRGDWAARLAALDLGAA